MFATTFPPSIAANDTLSIIWLTTTTMMTPVVANTKLNNDMEYIERVKSIYEWLIPLMIVILLLAIFGNGIIVLSSPWLSSPVSPYLKLCVSLAAADMWAASLLITGLLVNSYLPVVFGFKKTTFCYDALLEMFRISGMLTSDMHLFALAINQFLGTMYPLKYKIMVTTRRIRYIILCLWIIPLIFVFGWFVANEDDGLRHEVCHFTFYNRFPFRITIFLIFMLPLISTLVIYGMILAKLLKAKFEFETYCSDRRIDFNKKSTRNLSTRSTNVYSKLKLVWTTLLIVSTFSLSWGLVVLYFVMVCAEGCMLAYQQNIWRFFMSSSVNILVMLKLASNPFIYTLRIKAIRSSVDHFINFLLRRKRNDSKFGTHSLMATTVEPSAI